MEVVRAVAVEGHVTGAFVEARGLDAAAPEAGGEAGPGDAGLGLAGLRIIELGRDVGPGDAAVSSELDVAVVGADPDQAGDAGRFGDGDDRAVGLGAGDVGRDAAGRSRPFRPVLRGVLGLVVRRQVGADDHPVFAPVDGLEQVVAAEVDRLGIVRGEEDRRAPVEAEGAALLLHLGPHGRLRIGRRGLGLGLGGGLGRGLLVRRRSRIPFLVVDDVHRRRADLPGFARLDVDPLDRAALALAVGDPPVLGIVLGVEAVAAADVVPEIGQELTLAVHRRAAPACRCPGGRRRRNTGRACRRSRRRTGRR